MRCGYCKNGSLFPRPVSRSCHHGCCWPWIDAAAWESEELLLDHRVVCIFIEMDFVVIIIIKFCFKLFIVIVVNIIIYIAFVLF